MTLNESVNKAHVLRTEKKNLETQIEELNARIKEIDEALKPIDSDILNALKEKNKDELEFEGGIFANLFRKESTGYTDESAVIKWLKDNNFAQFVKVTEAINKKDLNKELKTNASLKTKLDSMLSTKVTEYITVTDAENHEKMIGHIKENTK